MIIPQPRLLFWFAAVVLPFGTLGAVYAESLPLALAAIGGLMVLAVLDAALGHGSLAGITLKLPEVVRLSKERSGQIEIQARDALKKGRRLRLALPLPEGFRSPAEELNVSLPTDSEWSRLEWPCTALKRGRYRLRRSHLECSSPLGFWAVRATVPVESEIRVYPNLLSERRRLAAMFLHRGSFGTHAQRQVGKGREFEKLREYIPGDSFEDIHWKATAKRGRPVTKVFQVEKTQEIYVIIDASRLSARPAGLDSRLQVPGSRLVESTTSGPLSVADIRSPDSDDGRRTTDHEQQTPSHTLERFITSALVLGLVAEQQGDLFGLLTFSDKVETFVRAKNGQAHYDACRDALYTLEPRLVSPDFEELVTFLRLRLRRRALLVFLTALDDPLLAESFVRSMDLICRQHLILVNMLKPPGARPLFSNPTVTLADDLYQELGGHLQWHKLRELDKTLQRRGVGFSLLDREEMSVQLVSQYVGVKRRQVL